VFQADFDPTLDSTGTDVTERPILIAQGMDNNLFIQIYEILIGLFNNNL
jgi:hypothetical protein